MGEQWQVPMESGPETVGTWVPIGTTKPARKNIGAVSVKDGHGQGHFVRQPDGDARQWKARTNSSGSSRTCWWATGVEAAAKRRRAQYGAAAAGRHGQSIQAARARNGMPDMKVLAEVAEAAMNAGNALVQASVEHLEEAERSWDKYVKESGSKIRGFPTKMAAGGGGAGSHERPRSEQLLLQRWRVSGSGRNARS